MSGDKSQVQPGLDPHALSPRLKPDSAYARYISLPSLEQPHLLDGDELVSYHHALHTGRGASKLMTGAWCQIDLAHVRDFEGQRAEGQELIAWARVKALRCQCLIASSYRDHSEFYDLKHRAALLGVYTSHFAQLGPVHWPDEPTDFQRNAYKLVQRELLDPVVGDFFTLQYTKDKANQKHFGDIKGVMAQLLVLQSLNKVQAELEYPEWAVAPASMREDSRGLFSAKTSEAPSTAFDVRMTFTDQTFIPIEVKWKKLSGWARSEDRETGDRRNYDESIARVNVSSAGYPPDIAQAMHRDVNGEASADDLAIITRLTRMVARQHDDGWTQGQGSLR